MRTHRRPQGSFRPSQLPLSSQLPQRPSKLPPTPSELLPKSSQLRLIKGPPCSFPSKAFPAPIEVPQHPPIQSPPSFLRGSPIYLRAS